MCLHARLGPREGMKEALLLGVRNAFVSSPNPIHLHPPPPPPLPHLLWCHFHCQSEALSLSARRPAISSQHPLPDHSYPHSRGEERSGEEAEMSGEERR